MNPTNSYRDTTLDGMVDGRSSSSKKASRHSRQASTATREAFPPPTMAGGQRGPTIAYPGTDLTGQGVQRSFSQRARGRPFADEAFADDSLVDSAKDSQTQRQSRSRNVSAQEPLQAGQLPERQSSRRQQIIQDNIQSAANAVRSPRDQHDSRTASTNNGYAYDNVGNTVPGLTKAPAFKDLTSPSDQREWAPDRSPLQKLEVTLNDISKEEKRARVQEAEMLHREKTRSQQPRTNPATIEDVGMVRGLSNAHKDRLQHSTVIESRKPDAARLSTDRPGFEYQNAALPVRSVTITRRSRRGSSGQPSAATATTSQRAASSSQAQPHLGAPPATVQNRSVSATQPEMQAVPTDRLASQGSQRSRQKPIYDSDRVPTAQERNASHRAALEQLTGASASQPSRTDSKRARNVPDPYVPRTSDPATTSRNLNASSMQDPGRTRSTQPAQTSARTVTPQGQTVPMGLGVQDSPGLRSVDSPVPVDGVGNAVQKHKRRSSVSFKEPYDRRRPVDEWKAAEIARLTTDDYLLEPRSDTTRNKAWWEEDAKSRRRSSRSKAAAMSENIAIDDRLAEFSPKLFVRCGPLLRYTGMKRTTGQGAKEYWRGTIMLVTQDSQSSYETPPVLRLFSQPKSLYTHPAPVAEEAEVHDEDSQQDNYDPLAGTIKMSRIGRALYLKPVHSLPPERDLSQIETDDGLYESAPPIANAHEHSVSVAPVSSRLGENNGERHGRYKETKGVRLYADPDRDVTFWLFKLEIQLGPEQRHIGYRINGGAASGFWVPAEGQTMSMMFHSCNGFSMSVKPDEFSGPDPLWRDVLNAHQSRPFHVMIGGGDQIYNDKAMRYTRYFAEWTANKNPHYKHHAPFTTEMKEELESFYLDNYCLWFSSGLFALAGSQIPMVNMWDDHDIIDGFGSYPHPFQMSPVFSGIGNVAFKYYMLFQQHSVEAMTSADEPSWVLGYKPGPYIKQLSRSIFLDLGKSVAFLALDCRTERMKNQVLSVDTCDKALDHCRNEIIEGQTKHLIVLLGVPIAYPRMNWLENVLTSRAMDPVKALGRYGVIKGGFLNRFDGGVEVLDDLDDHWTAHHHKEERNEFIKELQDLAAERSVRITILGGDVHLAAMGQFYSNPKLKIPKDRDHRYMPNVVSSAIVNTPPPEMLADVLNKRNKVHHLDSYTDESMIPMFTHDVDLKKRNNKHMLPRRNWCSITEYIPGRTPPSSRGSSPSRSTTPTPDDDQRYPQPQRRSSLSRGDVNPMALFRRLSSRNAPPTAYREGGYPAEDGGQRAASFDETRQGRSGPTSWNEKLGLTRRTASETREPVRNGDDPSGEEVEGRRPPPFRPGFHRRPTNLSEKAAKKGNVPAIDAEGNEFDVNDHVNLDGGLDIILNCEVDRKDPRGITEPYRLLVPALWYDGSSDREKLAESEGLQRKPTLMNKLGFSGNRGHQAAQNQGAGNWGQEMSETESYSDSEEDNGERPKKKLGLFASLRRKRPDHDDTDGRNTGDHMGAAAGIPPQPSDFHENSFTAPTATTHGQTTVPSSTTPKETPPRMSYQAAPGGYDTLYDSRDRSQDPSKASFNRPPSSSRDIAEPPPQRSSSFKVPNVLRKNSLKRQAAADRGPAMAPTSSAQYQPETIRQSQLQAQPVPPEPISPTVARQNSYTIGSARANRSRQQGQSNNIPYDADSAYMSSQQGPTTRAVSNPLASGPPSAYPAHMQPDDAQRTSSTRSTSMGFGGRFGKQNQMSGTRDDHDDFGGSGRQRSLRGNGILGRLGLGKHSASADQVPTQRTQAIDQPPAHPRSQDDFAAPQRTLSQGYSGIEAYRETPKRGLSMRDRARNFIERMEGRNRYDDEDDDGESYSSEESYSSAGVGEIEEDQSQPEKGGRRRLQKLGQSLNLGGSSSKGTRTAQPPPQPPPQQQPQSYPQPQPQFQPQSQSRSQGQPTQQRPQPMRDESQDTYSDDGSYLSEEYEREEYGAPKRGFSQRLREGMSRMGSSSKRTGEGSNWKSAFGRDRDRVAAEDRQEMHYY